MSLHRALRTIGRLAYAASRRIVKPIPRSIAYIHIPKCGGTSLHQAICRHYPDDKVTYLDPTASGIAANRAGTDLLPYRRDLLAYQLARSDGHRFISGHWPVDADLMTASAETWDMITVLRDPVERWISNYLFNRHRANNRDHFGTDLSIEAYLETQEAMNNGRLFVSFCRGGVFDGCETFEAMEDAKSTLSQFKLIGCLDQMDDFLARFKDRYGVQLNLPELNTSPAPPQARDNALTPDVMKRIEALCVPDRALYEWACNRLL